MKNARNILVAMLGLIAGLTAARADSDATDDPNVQVDADGVPLSISKPKPERLSPEEITEIRNAQEQAELNKTWLLRNYEQQLQTGAYGNSGNDPSSNLYYQLASDKNLAKLAGLPDLYEGGDHSSAYRTGSTSAAHNSAALRQSAPSALPGSTLQANNYLKPFITPLSAPSAAGLPDFYSSLPGTSSTSSPRGSASVVNAAENPNQAEDPTDIETPGMIAAEKNSDAESLNLSLDVLPGVSIEHARDHQDNDELLALPLPMTADQLHRAQAISLSPPTPTGAPLTAGTPAAPPKAIPVNEEDEPVPASKAPTISPVRAPIANPFDILNR